MSNFRIQKGITITLVVLLIAVLPTMILSSNNVELALAQSANQTSSSASTRSPAPPPPLGGPLGIGPMERSTQIGTIPTNQTCMLTPSLIEVEDTPQATEGPYFVDEMLNRSDIRPDPTDGSVQEGVPLTLVLHVYDVNEG